ncbi:MAG: helix-turn-helix domain-containing protein [Clostridiales bacterium]|nr:helix-turn-helix domain-containing protein [Clostridiales bacterium]
MSGISFNNLKRLRIINNLTQEDIAEKLGVTRQAVAKWERGETKPDIESCIKLADLYQMTVDRLLRQYDQPENDGDGKYLFGIVKINDKGQITLPVECRKMFHLEPGDNMIVLADEDKGIALVKV